MVKIGGKSGGLGGFSGSGQGGESVGSHDPFVGLARPLDRGDAPGLSWFSAHRAVANELAVAWFGQYESLSLGEYYESVAGEDPLAGIAQDFITRNHSDWLTDRVVPSVLAGASSLGEFVPFGTSALGPKLVEFLHERGVTGSEIPVIAAGGLLLEMPDVAVTWQGAWATEFGSRAFNRFEIYRDASGLEWCYVHTNIAVATRKPLGLGDARCKYVAVPRLLLSQLFIAETPFPSSIMSMGRGIAYPDVPEELWPHPFVSVDNFALTTHTEGYADRAGNLQHHWFSAPEVIRAGYAFSAESEEFFDTIIPTVVDATTHLSTIAEDGFRNYRTPGCDIPYDYTYGSEYVHFEGEGVYPGVVASSAVSAAGYSRFIPEVFLGQLIEATNQAIGAVQQTANPAERRALMEWIVLEGAGQHVASEINSLCWEFLMPEQDWQTATWLLEIAIDLDVLNESTNALSNLGQVQFAMGNSEGAKETLQKALDRLDKYSEGEACYHLGLIFSEEGDEVSAKSYWERGAQAEGGFDEEYASKCREKLGSVGLGTNSTTEAPSPKFCGQCGTPLAPGVRFCGNCGAATGI